MTLTPEHHDIYATFVSKLLSRAEASASTRSLLGRPLCEMAEEHCAAIKNARAGTGEPFDTFKAVQEFILSLNDYVKWMSEKGDTFCLELRRNFALINEVYENKQRFSWMTDHGKFLVQRALDLQPSMARQVTLFPLRGTAAKAALITSYDSLVTSSTASANWKIALQAALSAFENYRFDFTSLTKADGPCFIQRSGDVSKMVGDIDSRIAAKAAAAAAAAEAAEQEAAEQAREEEALAQQSYSSGNGTTYVPRAYDDEPTNQFEPVEMTPVPEPEVDYWANWEPEYNPANGLPMVGHLDIHNNTWGSNFNDFP